jgi:hypothetical protein
VRSAGDNFEMLLSESVSALQSLCGSGRHSYSCHPFLRGAIG